MNHYKSLKYRSSEMSGNKKNRKFEGKIKLDPACDMSQRGLNWSTAFYTPVSSQTNQNEAREGFKKLTQSLELNSTKLWT